MVRTALIAFALMLAVASPAGAQSSSFAPLAGTAGCIAQLGTMVAGEGGALPSCAPGRALNQVEAVTISADGRFVYAAASGHTRWGGNAVLSFERDPATGALRQLGCVSDNGTDGRIGTDGACADGDALLGANDVALSPDGRALYVTTSSSNGVAWFDRDPQTGEIKQAGCLKEYVRNDRCGAARPLHGASGVAASPDNRHVYVAAAEGDGVVALERDTETGKLSMIECTTASGSDGACVDGMGLEGASDVAVSADGATVYVTSAMLGGLLTFSRDAETGKLTQTGCLLDEPVSGGRCRAVPTLAGAASIAVADGGDVYVGAASDSSITRLRHGADGALSAVGCVSHAAPAGDDAVERDEGEEDEDFDDREDEEEWDDEEEAAAARASRLAARRGRAAQAVSGCAPAKALNSAADMTLTPDGRSLLVAGYGTLAMFERDPASGALRQTMCAEAYQTYKSCIESTSLYGTAGIVASPDARNVYIASRGSNALLSFAAAVAVTGRSVGVTRAGIARVTLACPAARVKPCAGQLRASSRRAGAAAAGKAFRIAPGARSTVALRLPSDVRRARRASLVATDASRRVRATQARVVLRRSR